MLFQADLFGVILNDLPLQEGGFYAHPIPIGLMAFADDADQVALLGMVNGVVNGLLPIRDLHIGHIRLPLAMPL